MKKAQFVNRGRKGFTLLEALFAVLIIAVLAAIAVPMYANTRKDAQKKTCKSNIRAIAGAMSKYAFSNGVYTIALANLSTHGLTIVPACPAGGAYTVSGAEGTVDARTISCDDTGHVGAANNDFALPAVPAAAD